MRTLVILPVLTAFLSGCMPLPTVMPYVPPSQVRKVIRGEPEEVVDGEFEPLVIVKGKQGISDFDWYGTPAFAWRLASTFDKKTKIETFGVSLRVLYDNHSWKFWDSAATSRAERLDVAVSGRDVGACHHRTGCLYSESLVAFLSADQVAAATQDGIRIRFKSKQGDVWDVDYSAGEIQYQLHTMKEATAKYR